MTSDDHTFLFADLAGEFFALVDRLAGEHGAKIVKTIGDAVMLRADSARAAPERYVPSAPQAGA